jgi:hypothetical protein
MATAAQAGISRPSDNLRQAQQMVRSILVNDDLLEEEMLLEFVRTRLTDIEAELGELWGRQMMFEAVMKT